MVDGTGLFDRHPFTGFDVVAHSYANEVGPDAPRLDPETVASTLMTTIVEEWLRPDPAVADWEISEPVAGEDDHAGEFAIYIGPIDAGTDDFADPIVVVVRESAGGALMVLLNQNGRPHADRITRYAAAALAREPRAAERGETS